MKVLHLVHEVKHPGGYEDGKMIGVYSDLERANAAIDQIRDQPGFRDHLDGFVIESYEVDRTHWQDGFFTVPVGCPWLPGEALEGDAPRWVAGVMPRPDEDVDTFADRVMREKYGSWRRGKGTEHEGVRRWATNVMSRRDEE